MDKKVLAIVAGVIAVIVVVIVVVCVTMNKNYLVTVTVKAESATDYINTMVSMFDKEGKNIGDSSIGTEEGSSGQFGVPEGEYTLRVTNISDENYTADDVNITVDKDMDCVIELKSKVVESAPEEATGEENSGDAVEGEDTVDASSESEE